MFRKTLVKGLAAAALVAGTAQEAAAVDWAGNGNYCAGNLYNTCFSVNLSWTGQVATLTVENFTGEGDLIKAVGITNLSNIADDFLFTLGGQAGYCRSGIDAGCPNEIGGLPSGNGQYDNAAVAATNDQGSMVADGGSGTWTFTFPAGFDMSNLANANVGGHFISGPSGCSTKWEVTSGGDFNEVEESECTETVVPEPATMMLLATGLVGLGGAGVLRRRKQQNS